MIDYLSTDKQFNLLSLLDLLEARDLFHIHLMHKPNVVATAIGRYLIRETDPWPQSSKQFREQTVKTQRQVKPARTLANSEVRPYSWPCILVFVDKWVDRDKFGTDEHSSNDLIPKAIYMPDGRVVPICVVKAELEETVEPSTGEFTFPSNLIGGGYPVIADVQGQQKVASMGCLVTDGHLTYALTNRHVSGASGERVYSILDGAHVEIGKSSEKQLTRMLFQDVYSGWPGKNVYVNLDVGLIEINDRTQWTAQVFGVGQLGKLADLSINNISLKLIECPVRAFGCASQKMFGQIYALFYRYKQVGGFEYVADFLIGPRRTDTDGSSGRSYEENSQSNLPFSINPGDSGTLWVLDTGDEKAGLMPFAILWGSHEFVANTANEKKKTSYALATCLSTVCSLLNVDVVRGWNIGHPERWGEMGHYTIGAKACGLIKDANLRTLMTANMTNIGFDDGMLRAGKFKHKSDPDPQNPAFVPLADVADNVWRPDRGHPEKKPFARPEDENNHFADMDQVGFGEFANKTLLKVCEDVNNVDPEVWGRFYDSLKGHHLGRVSPGALPFRVWQIYEAMVDFVSNKKVPEFVCAAGLLAHYVGDACQPLHVSRLHHGDPKPEDTKEIRDEKGAVHSVYETTMLNNFRDNAQNGSKGLLDRVNQTLNGKTAKADVVGGRAAAAAVIELMRQTVKRLPPEDIIAAFPLGKTPSEQAAALWKKFKVETTDCIANGCLRLSSFWESAWKEGHGNQIDPGKLIAIPPKKLQKLYQDPEFLQSVALAEYSNILNGL
jgi:hypothetical protein